MASSHPIEVFITLDAETLEITATASRLSDKGFHHPVDIVTRIKTILPEDKPQNIIDLTIEDGKNEALPSLCSSSHVAQCPFKACKNKIDIDNEFCTRHTPSLLSRSSTPEKHGSLFPPINKPKLSQCSHIITKGERAGEQCTIKGSILCSRHKTCVSHKKKRVRFA